jgi:primase-polymerase (primpol)-like protein
MSRFDFTHQQDSEDNTGGGDCLPSRLKDHNQWLVTQDKKPVAPSKGWQKSVNHLTFTEAQEKAEQLSGEVAFCFTKSGPFVGFDLDDVKVDGEFTDEALGIVRRLDSYTEVSSSGTGLHIIAEGDRLDDRKHRADLSEAGHLEVYDDGQYFALTGVVYDGITSVENRPTVIREVQDGHLPKRQKFSFNGQQTPMSVQQFDGGETDVTPEKVRQTIRAYVESDNHDVDREVLRLWQGSNEGRASPSDADMAFVKQLYYWCKGDQKLMDECFRASGRYGMRPQQTPKWDEVHYSNEDTYGEGTIREVCRTNCDTFDGRYVK